MFKLSDEILPSLSILGLKVKDKVTGFVGVCESVGFDLYGCIQVVVKPEAVDGEVKLGNWFDIARLEIIDVNIEPVMENPFYSEVKKEVTFDYKKGPAEKPTMK